MMSEVQRPLLEAPWDQVDPGAGGGRGDPGEAPLSSTGEGLKAPLGTADQSRRLESRAKPGVSWAGTSTWIPQAAGHLLEKLGGIVTAWKSQGESHQRVTS